LDKLPDQNINWPPAPYDKSYDDMKIWSAWYEGDTGTLASHYTKTQTIGGISGALRRLWWGKPEPAGQESRKLHIPVAADIARTSADLLFSEMPTFLVGEGTENATDGTVAKTSEAQRIVGEIMGSPQAASQLLEAAELQAALGGSFLRLSWDTEMFEYVQLDAVDADGAIPHFRRGKLVSVVFWQNLRSLGKDRDMYRFLERHFPGGVEYGLYKGTQKEIGHRVPLQEHPDAEWAASLVDKDSTQATGLMGLTAAYIPNVTPNRSYRNTPQLARLGRSDFDQLIPLFDSLDEAYTSMMRDLRLGKARAWVPQGTLTNNGPGKGASFDTDREIYAEAPAGLGSMKDGKVIQVDQPNIRHEEHHAVIEDLLAQILRTAGYSSASFGDDPMIGQMTATEVNERREMSTRTRNKKIQHWKSALEPLATTALEAQKLVYGNQGLAVDDVTVRFPTQTNVNAATLSQSISQLAAAGAISTERMVRMQNPNWSSDDVNREVAKIHFERNIGEMPDPTKFTGE